MMTDTLKFGPEWLRQLSSGGSMTSPPPSPSFGGKYKLADNRYGREEMLALFTPNPKAPDDLRQFTSILVERCQDPMAMIAPTEEEQHLLASNVNSTVALRQVMGSRGGGERGPPGMRGTARGGLNNRGRGRGRGEPAGFYQRGSFDDPISGRESNRGRGGREGGATKVIERDSSGFLSARSFDESTDRRLKDPFSRSTPSSADRWSELRSARNEPGGRPNVPPEQQTEEPTTPAGEERDDDWRRAGKDRQPRGNWRDAKPSFDDDTATRYPPRGGGFGRQMSYERSRSRQQEDELPEWATEDMGAGDEGGTFDSSGAFLSLKEVEDGKPYHNGDFSKKDRKQEIDKAKKSLPPLKIPTNTANESPASIEEQEPDPSNSQAPPTGAGVSRVSDADGKSSISTSIPSNRSIPRHEDTASLTQTANITPASAVQSESMNRKQKSQTNIEPEADFDHLTEAAEQMMADWAAEEDDHLPSSGNRSGTPTDPRSLAHPNDWFYKDPQGTLQGPFKAQEMAEWYGAGYFTMTLLVKKGSDRDFQPLGEIIKRGGNSQPFVPVTPGTVGVNPLADPAILSAQAVQDPRLQQQQLYLLQQQQLLLQQQQQIALLRQQQHLQHIAQTISSREEYSNLSQQQLQAIAVNILLKEEQKHQNQAISLQQTNKHTVHQQSSPPQHSANGSTPATPLAPADDEMLWGRSWSQQMRERQAVDEIAQKEASRQQEQQRLEVERQLDMQREQQRIERLELERKQLMEAEIRKVEEQRRLLEEKAKAEIRLQREEMERQQREMEERKRQEIERQGLERKRQKDKHLEMERQRELERQKLLDRERHLEVERKIVQEAKKKAELQRKREEEERLHKETMDAEVARRQELQRLEQERNERELARQAAEKERERQAERERLEALQLPSTAQWASNPNPVPVYDRQQSLHEIQKKEKEQATKDKAAKAAAEEKQRQLEQQELNNQQTQLKWAANKSQPPANGGKSLRKIQEEEALRLEEERKEQQKAAPVASTGSSSWGAGKPVAVTGWANEGAWGNAVRKGTWDQPDSKPVKTSNSDVFPSLAASIKPQPSSTAQQKKKQTNSAQNTKKSAQNEKVKKIFQNMSSEDKFTDWCTKSLQGLNSSIDVPTFVSFLREVDNPYEVQDYVKSYLGDTPKSVQFAKDFVERRSQANKQKMAEQRMDDEESLWGPAPAVNPSIQRSSTADPTSAAMEKKKKAAKKSKAPKADASSLLAFTVGASSHRLNIGEIEKAE